MNLPVTLVLLLGGALTIPALAQTTTSETQRDTYQPQRIDHTEANAAANVHVVPYEQARAQGREDLQSARIHRQKHD